MEKKDCQDLKWIEDFASAADIILDKESEIKHEEDEIKFVDLKIPDINIKFPVIEKFVPFEPGVFIQQLPKPTYGMPYNFMAPLYPETGFLPPGTYQPAAPLEKEEDKARELWVDDKIKIVKTQKAKGIMFCLEQMLMNYPRLNRFFRPVQHKFIDDIDGIKKNYFLPSFARPCPMQPRHGFVDSRIIKSNNELFELWKEVKAQDKDGEIVLGPYFPGVEYSSVLVSSGSLAIGKGNDGATAGKDSISFPIAPHKFPRSLVKEAGISKEDAIYVESIYNGSKWYIVQMRGGPAIDSVSPDFIPEKIVVKEIVQPHDDLLKWEKEVQEFKEGTVVYAANHTLASHAAIHCVLHNIPFITTYKPKIGETILPIKEKKNKLSRKKFRQGVHVGINICRNADYKHIYRYFYFALSVLHNWSYLRHSQHADWLLGAASALFSKICTALVLGEHRHKYKNGSRKNREDVYLRTLHRNMSPFHKLPEVFKDFYMHKWGSGFGGVPWATCTLYSYSLWKAITSTYNKNRDTISEKEVSDMVTIINKTVNLAHNNGWWFNKIASSKDLDFIAKSPGMATLCISDIFAEVYNSISKIKGLKRRLKNVARINPPCSANSQGEMRWLRINGAQKYSRLILRSESGSEEETTLELSDKEIKALYRKYKRAKVSTTSPMILRLSKKNQFRIPGGPPRDVQEYFGVAL